MTDKKRTFERNTTKADLHSFAAIILDLIENMPEEHRTSENAKEIHKLCTLACNYNTELHSIIDTD